MPKQEPLYLTFHIKEKKGRTNVYEVRNKNSGDPIGTIKWHATWRRYCFFTDQGEITLSEGCMNHISSVIYLFTKEQKDGKHGG